MDEGFSARTLCTSLLTLEDGLPNGASAPVAMLGLQAIVLRSVQHPLRARRPCLPLFVSEFASHQR